MFVSLENSSFISFYAKYMTTFRPPHKVRPIRMILAAKHRVIAGVCPVYVMRLCSLCVPLAVERGDTRHGRFNRFSVLIAVVVVALLQALCI